MVYSEQRPSQMTLPHGATLSAPENSDQALAALFTELHGEWLRYVKPWRKWYFWNGRVWRPDDTKLVYDLARGVCRTVSAECRDSRQATAIASVRTVNAVVQLAEADRAHAGTPDQWDRDPWLLNTPAGVVNLRTGQTRPHEPGDYMTKITAVAPSENAPTFRTFLATVTADYAGLAEFLQRFVGYCLTGTTQEHRMVFIHGQGANGKSTLLNSVTRALGDYAKVAPVETFMASKSERISNDLAMLRGARFVAAQETDHGHHWSEAKIKALTGGDPITARFMRQDFFTYSPQFKLIIAGNHKPGLRCVDEAIRRRLILIPFTTCIPRSERDLHLGEKLEAEAGGILQWMIEGCVLYQRQGLEPPPAVLAATDTYMEAEDSIACWITERCLRTAGGRTKSTVLYDDWRNWASAAGEDPGSLKRFSQALETKGFTKDPTARNATFIGIALDVR